MAGTYCHQANAMWLLLVLSVATSWCIQPTAAAAGLIRGQCKPQGVLRLDKPYPSPARAQLPFCQQVSSAVNSRYSTYLPQEPQPQAKKHTSPQMLRLCQQQKHWPIATYTSSKNTVFCMWLVCGLQYGCSCCNASHALTLQRTSRVIAEDEDLSGDCKAGLLRLTCRVCDPLVSGTTAAQLISNLP